MLPSVQRRPRRHPPAIRDRWTAMVPRMKKTCAAAQDAAERLQRLRREVEPAKWPLLAQPHCAPWLADEWMVLGLARDALTLDTVTCRTVDISSWPKSTIPEAGGHRPRVVVSFEDEAGDELGRMSVFLDVLSSHSSVAGDDLEMKIVGHTSGRLHRTNVGFLDGLRGRRHQETWRHDVGTWASEVPTAQTGARGPSDA